MIKLKQSSHIGGDETSAFDVILDKDYTIKTLIDEILLRKYEWGDITIKNENNTFKDVCEYRNGLLTGKLSNTNLNQIVKKVYAAGGWSLMHYYVIIE